MQKFRTWTRPLPAVVLCAGGVSVAMFMAATAWFFLRGGENYNQEIYIAVGRAMLNGLTPYKDILEIKPPGIFVLGALSLLAGGRWLGNVASVGLMLAPVVCCFLMRHRWKPGLTAWAAVIGIALTSVTAALLAGTWGPEAYGAPFGVLYILFIANRTPGTKKEMLAAAALLFCTIGFKEPFVLSCAAGALVLLPTWKSFSRGFLIPVAIAATAGVAALAITGMLKGYATVYLPDMLGYYVPRQAFPLWMRGLAVDRFGAFSNIVQLMPLWIAGLTAWLFVAAWQERGRHTLFWVTVLMAVTLMHVLGFQRPSLLSATSLLCIIVFVAGMVVCGLRAASSTEQRRWLGLALGGTIIIGIHSYVPVINGDVGLLALGVLLLVTVIPGPRTNRLVAISAWMMLASALLLQQLDAADSILMLRTWIAFTLMGIIAVACAAMAMISSEAERSVMPRALVLLAALWLAIASVGIGTDFQGHHFAAFAPAIAALVCAVANTAHTARRAAAFAVMTGITGLSVQWNVPGHFPEHLKTAHARLSASLETAKHVDALLDACDIDRYVAIVRQHEPFYGATRHSPMNFFLWANWSDQWYDDETVLSTELQNLSHTKAIIVERGFEPDFGLESALWTYVQGEFTAVPPACAGDKAVFPKHDVLFRKNDGHMGMSIRLKKEDSRRD